MSIYIALLRGINVGGHKKVPMAELRELLTNNGFQNVQTYIQSGNVIFESLVEQINNIEEQIKKAILDHFGFDVSVIVKTRPELQAVFDDCPFIEVKKEKSYFTMLSSKPNKELVELASKKNYPDEEYVIINDCIYFYCAKGYGQAKFSNNFFERKLKVTATARNYKTMVKLFSLCQDLD